MGIISLSLIPGAIGGPPLLGFLNDDTGSFLATSIFSAVVVFISSGFVLLLPKDGEAYRIAREEKLESS